MDLNLMMVLSMRQKEMSYQQILRSSTATPSSSFLAPPSPYGMAPQSPLMVGGGGGGGGGGSRQGYSVLPPLPRARLGMKTPPPPHGHLLPGGAISPLSVGHLPYANPTNTYDQFGFTWHWITEVCAHFALQRQTAHFAVQYAQLLLRKRAAMREQDVYAALRNYDDVFTVQRELRVLGITTVFMAAKIEEVHPPKAVDLAKFISERGGVTCAGEDLVRHEAKFLQDLNWNLHPTTPYSWLLFLLSGASVDQPLDTMGDFVNPAHNLAGTKELFVSAIRLIDTALLDYQSVDFLPSVLAGTALLLVDQSLDLMFVAQFLQLDANVLWECKTWLYALTYSVCDLDCQGTQDKDRWTKVPDEELLFIQALVPVPTHLANGLLRSENTSYSYPSSVNNQFGTGCASCNGFNASGGVYQSGICASPCSSDNYGCFCKGGYHTCGNTTPGPHVYHFKYGWQGVDGGLAYDAGVSNQETMHYA